MRVKLVAHDGEGHGLLGTTATARASCATRAKTARATNSATTATTVSSATTARATNSEFLNSRC